MKNFLLFTVCIAFVSSVFSQTPDTVAGERIYTIIETMPEFPGGQTGLAEYIKDNLVYPEIAKKKKIEGKVIIRFVVNYEGNVTSVRVLEGIHPSLDEEAIRVISEMPRWKPGTQNGEPVNVSFNLPLDFKLSSNKH